ncbi:hypothetical protein T484DRAFT_1811519 [Baffinella frigidus]|nr:hypothetical protein T484DRAFT_1811519 [Cryptophyta sp. CCMP2293]
MVRVSSLTAVCLSLCVWSAAVVRSQHGPSTPPEEVFVGPSGPAAPTSSFWYIRASTLLGEREREQERASSSHRNGSSLAVMPVANPAGLAGARAGACLFLGEASQPQGCSAWAAALAGNAHFSTIVLADLISARPPSGTPGIMECVRQLASLPTLEMPLNITLSRVDALEDPFLLSVFTISSSAPPAPPPTAATPPPHGRRAPTFTSPSATPSAAAAPLAAGGVGTGAGGGCARAAPRGIGGEDGMRACLAGCAFSPQTIGALEVTGVRRGGARGGGAFVTPVGGAGVVYGGDASHAKNP